ncbi:hypothetical protein [Nocardia cyriacigeorgica]|uniref:hypothetical protein n=1 Tax=Nocardia cyriacigeorgica TaxID=135487 RepID=UPI0018963102|nr:hypothetical protein [Nocardia cyriacigeorgica]
MATRCSSAKVSMSDGLEQTVQRGRSPLRYRELGEQTAIGPRHQRVRSRPCFIGQPTEFRTRNEVENGLFDTGDPAGSEVPPMPLKVELIDVAPHKVDRRGSVGQLQSAPVAARRHNRNRQRAWDRTVDPSG